VPKNFKRILAITALALAVLYAGDYLLLRDRIKKGRDAYGTVQVESYSAVPEKGNKVEFFYNDPETEECVHSLFPHLGDNPCWYASRTSEKRTDL
jgi:hypothetical protein